MRYMVLLVCVVTLCGMFGCTPAEPEGKDESLVLLPEEGNPFIAFKVWVKAGSQNDPAGKEGLAVLTADMIAEGSTETLKYEEILEKLYPMATGYGASVDKEMTVFTGAVHKDNLEEFYGLFKDALLKPAFSEEDFKRVLSEQQNFVERTRRYSSDEELGKEVLFHRIYSGTSYGAPEEGYVSSVKNLTLDDIKEFYGKFYTRDNIVVGLAGGYPPELPEKVKADFEVLPEGEVEPVPVPEPKKIEGLNVLIVEKPAAPTTAISFGFPIELLRGDADFFAMFLVNSWFGEHRNSSSHLYQVIRVARGMNYGDYSYIEAWPNSHFGMLPAVNAARHSQIFQVWIRPVKHEEAFFAFRAALRELQKLVDNGLSEEQYEITRNFLHNYTMAYGNTTSRRLGYAIDDLFYGLEGDGFLKAIRPGLEELTLRQVNDAIMKHLQYKDMWVVFITSDAEGLKQALVTEALSPKTYLSEKPQEVLAEDKEIEAYPVNLKPENVHIVKIGELFEK
jgi:zinc protease